MEIDSPTTNPSQNRPSAISLVALSDLIIALLRTLAIPTLQNYAGPARSKLRRKITQAVRAQPDPEQSRQSDWRHLRTPANVLGFNLGKGRQMKFVYAEAAFWVTAIGLLMKSLEIERAARKALSAIDRQEDVHYFWLKYEILMSRAAIYKVGATISIGLAVAVGGWAIPVIQAAL